MEQSVEDWLNEHTEWFKMYAIENLDISTVEKWLRANGKRICKCNNRCEMFEQQANMPDKYNKSHSSSQSQQPNLNEQVDSPSSSSETNSIKPKLNLNNSKICSSHMFNCVIHTQRCLMAIKKEHFFDTIPLPSTQELSSDLEDDDYLSAQKNQTQIANSVANNEKSSKSMRKEIVKKSNSFNQDKQDDEDENMPSSVLFKSLDNSNNYHFRKNSHSKSTAKRNSLIRTYNSTYPSTTSLNVLKFLIQSRIRPPATVTAHSRSTLSPYANTNTSKSATTKTAKIDLKSKYKKVKNYQPDLLLDLIKDISNETNLKELCEKITNNLKLLTNAEKVSLFFICHSQKYLASFKADSLFKMNGESQTPLNTQQTFTKDDFVFQMPFDATLLSEVAQHGNYIKLSNLNNDKRSSADNQVKSLLCMPIKNFNDEVIAVVQFVNKRKNENKIVSFDENDIKLINCYLPFCSISITNSQLFDSYTYEYERNRTLLEVVHDLFEQQTNLDAILFRIMQRAQTLLKCQRCSVLLEMDSNKSVLSEESTRKAFDLFQSGSKPAQRRHSVEEDDGRKISKELADHVIRTGEKINLADAYSDARFDPLVDTIWKFKTKAILCMPIRNRENHIIGCAQIANRLDNQPFDENDEQLFEAFCIFCGLGINNTMIYNQLEKSMAEKVVALEVLSYHAISSKMEINLFMNRYPNKENYHLLNKHMRKENLQSYLFDDFCLKQDEMVLASYEMFKHTGLMETFKIDQQTMFQWLLTVKKNYRDVAYHNFSHAFNVCQSMFAFFENSILAKDLQDIEKLALLVGCLCHDLDHRGTNNMFQLESHSALAQLYGTSGILEKHHFNHCIMILNSPGHNIFAFMKPKTYALAISYIKEAILATDLANHFSIRKSFEDAVKSKDVYWNEEPYCSLLRKHLMTSCDLASAAKPWPIHREVVNLLNKEFFAQGDRERIELNIEPNEMMDARRSHELPRLQIGWIDNVCLPLYKNMSILCDSLKEHVKRVETNRHNWSLLHTEFNSKL